MNKQFIKITSVLLLVLVGLSACAQGIPGTGGDVAATQEARVIEAARATSTQMALEAELSRLQTLVAQGTPASAVTPATAAPTDVGAPTNIVVPTDVVAPTVEATSTNLPSPTPLPPTATPTQVPPTATPTAVPTATLVPTATAIPLPCSDAAFVEDVSVRDGTVLAPGTSFTKTWRVRNTGRCTWDTGYDLVYYDGSLLNAPGVVRLPQVVYPGQTVDLSVEMFAPQSEGSYRSYWMLRDPSGVLFGLGASNQALYADIRVQIPENYNPLDFAANYCIAEWTTGAGRIPCQGQRSDARGFVRRIDNPILESGYHDDEPVLQTHPQMVNGGMIHGKYPALRIEQGWHFQSLIGCAHQVPGCDVTFQLNYQIGGGAVQSLGTWREAYEGDFQQIDVDLASLVGQDVNLILSVYANGSSHQDYAQWLAPRITSSIGWNE